MSEMKEKLHTEECKILQSHANSLYYNTMIKASKGLIKKHDHNI